MSLSRDCRLFSLLILYLWYPSMLVKSLQTHMTSTCRDHSVDAPANERWRYTVAPSLIGWAYTQNDPCTCTRYGLLWSIQLDWISISDMESWNSMASVIWLIMEILNTSKQLTNSVRLNMSKSNVYMGRTWTRTCFKRDGEFRSNGNLSFYLNKKVWKINTAKWNSNASFQGVLGDGMRVVALVIFSCGEAPGTVITAWVQLQSVLCSVILVFNQNISSSCFRGIVWYTWTI